MPELSNFSRTASWLSACGKQPGNLQQTSVQIGCFLEEVAEFIATLACSEDSTDIPYSIENALTELEHLSLRAKRGETVLFIKDGLQEKALDALCDIEVTANGVAYLSGWKKEGADKAVLDSNDAKLIDGKPVILRGGKIGKPDGWTAPELSKFIPSYKDPIK